MTGAHRRNAPVAFSAMPLMMIIVASALSGADRTGVPDGVADSRFKTAGSLGGLARVHDQHSVFVVADSGVHAGAALSQPLRIDSRVLKSLPARLQHHSLLRIQQFCLYWRNSEEGVVKLVDVVNFCLEQIPAAAGDFGCVFGCLIKFYLAIAGLAQGGIK